MTNSAIWSNWMPLVWFGLLFGARFCRCSRHFCRCVQCSAHILEYMQIDYLYHLFMPLYTSLVVHMCYGCRQQTMIYAAAVIQHLNESIFPTKKNMMRPDHVYASLKSWFFLFRHLTIVYLLFPPDRRSFSSCRLFLRPCLHSCAPFVVCLCQSYEPRAYTVVSS